MSIEYEGQTIQSMKWNGQEILGGSSGILSDVVVHLDKDVKAYGARNTYYNCDFKYTRFKNNEDGLYYVVLEFDGSKGTASTSSMDSNKFVPANAQAQYGQYSEYYQVPEGFRPKEFYPSATASQYGRDSDKVNVLVATPTITVGFRSDLKSYSQYDWCLWYAKNSDQSWANMMTGASVYECDYTGE